MQEEGERRGEGKRKSVSWLGAPRPPRGPRGLREPPPMDTVPARLQRLLLGPGVQVLTAALPPAQAQSRHPAL